MTGYEALAQASSPSKITVTLDLPKRAADILPTIGGAVLGAVAWPAHRVLGALDGAALAHNLYGLHAGTVTKKDAVRNLGSHALATMGALTLRTAAPAGYIMGALAGGLVARVLGVDGEGTTVFLGDATPSADTIYTDHDTVLAVQTALKSKGFDPGPLDGQMGPQTSAAIRNLQGALGADQSGAIDYGVLIALRITPSKQALAVKKNLESDLPTSGRPAKGWSQAATSESSAPVDKPAWKVAALSAGVIAGAIALLAGAVALVRR